MKMAKKNITKNDEKKASRAVVDTKSLDGSTRSGGIDRSGAALPLAYRKLNMQQQVYNTAREQQEHSKRYSKFIRYSFNNTLLIILKNTKSLHRNKFRRHTGFFSFLRIVFIKVRLRGWGRCLSSFPEIAYFSGGCFNTCGSYSTAKMKVN